MEKEGEQKRGENQSQMLVEYRIPHCFLMLLQRTLENLEDLQSAEGRTSILKEEASLIQLER